MKLVKLNNSVTVNPDHVVSVTRDYHDRLILVRDVLGQVHEIGVDYGKSAFETQDRITKLISGDLI